MIDHWKLALSRHPSRLHRRLTGCWVRANRPPSLAAPGRACPGPAIMSTSLQHTPAGIGHSTIHSIYKTVLDSSNRSSHMHTPRGSNGQVSKLLSVAGSSSRNSNSSSSLWIQQHKQLRETSICGICNRYSVRRQTMK